MKCDWYAATVPDDYQTVMGVLSNNLGGEWVKKPRGLNGYTTQFHLVDEFGLNATLLAGGNNGSNPHVFASGDSAIYFSKLVKESWPEHVVTRVDVAQDLYEPGLYSRLSQKIVDVAKHRKIQRLEYKGFANDGRESGNTLYLGSPTSPTRLRFYEKGKQLEQEYAKKGLAVPSGHKDFVRLEIQYRPPKQMRENVAKMSFSDIWGVSHFTKDVAKMLLDLDIEKVYIDPKKSPTDEQAIYWLLRQYSPLANRHGGWSKFGNELEKVAAEMKLLKGVTSVKP